MDEDEELFSEGFRCGPFPCLKQLFSWPQSCHLFRRNLTFWTFPPSLVKFSASRTLVWCWTRCICVSKSATKQFELKTIVLNAHSLASPKSLSRVITYVAEVDIKHQVKEWSRLSCKIYAKCGHILWRSYVHLTHMGFSHGRRTGGPTRRSSKGGWTPLEVYVFLDMHTLQRLHMELQNYTLYEGWAQLRVGFGCYVFDWLALSSLKHGTKTSWN